MERFFSFKVKFPEYPSYITEKYSNKYGNWRVEASHDNDKCIFQLFYSLRKGYEAMNKLKVYVYHTDDNNDLQIEPTFRLDDRKSYLCKFECPHHVYDCFEMEIKVDTSSIGISYMPEEDLESHGKMVYEENQFTDVTLKTPDGGEVKASKIFLSRSPVFKAMFSYDTKEAQENVIEIADMTHDVLDEMVRYIYSDKVPKIKEMALDLLVAADKYNLPGLVMKCKNYLKRSLSIDNFAQILETCDKISAVVDLKQVAINFVIDNHKEVFATDNWKFVEQNFHQLALEITKQCINDLNIHLESTSYQKLVNKVKRSCE